MSRNVAISITYCLLISLPVNPDKQIKYLTADRS